MDDDLPDEEAAAPLDDEQEDHDEFEALDEDTEIDEDGMDEDLDQLEDDASDGGDIDAVVEMTSQEQSARSLEIRRALEERREQKKLSEDLDYLDLDFDD